MSEERIFKNAFMGFNKEDVIDYIEELQKENRKLKKQVQELQEKLTAATSLKRETDDYTLFEDDVAAAMSLADELIAGAENRAKPEENAAPEEVTEKVEDEPAEPAKTSEAADVPQETEKLQEPEAAKEPEKPAGEPVRVRVKLKKKEQ